MGGKEECAQSQSAMMAQGPIQDMRVDNWGNYCLQRLHSMYEKGDFCDLTIQFHNNQILKVHRVVVNLCTEYFANLEREVGLTSGMLVLPEQIDFQALSTIIKFFYTGKLEVRGNQFNEIYKTVQILNVTILIKLLEARAKKSPQQAIPHHATGGDDAKHTLSPIITAVETKKKSPVDQKQLSVFTTASQGLRRPFASPTGGGVMTKTVLARVQPHHPLKKHVSPTTILSACASNGKHIFKKKLPIWKERKHSPASTEAEGTAAPTRWTVKDEPARPTRFEWPDPDEESSSYSATNNASNKTKESTTSTRGGNIFDAIKTQNSAAANTSASTTPASEVTEGNQVQVSSNGEHNKTTNAENNIAAIEDPIERELADMEKEDDQHPATATPQANNVGPTDTSVQPSAPPVNGEEKDKQGEEMEATTLQTQNVTATTCQDNEVTVAVEADPLKPSTEETETSGQLQPVIDCSELTSTPENPLSHSRIISEVFKAYPDLVKDNRNIKLKIVQKNSPNKTEKLKESRSKVSYVILKSTSSNNLLESPLLAKKGSRLGKRIFSSSGSSSFWDSPNNKNSKAAGASTSGADNMEGPWICGRCNSLQFEAYAPYRKHLVEVHGDKIDARICEHCGYKASKRNLLLYHLYTKHGIEPRNFTFPHCDQCEYVGLTESLLAKHKQVHTLPNDFVCQGCKTEFATAALVQRHTELNPACASACKFTCPICGKKFAKSVNVKAHIRSVHKRSPSEFISKVQHQQQQQVAAASSTTDTDSSIVLVQGEEILGTLNHEDLQQLQHLPQPVIQTPSSEAEALTNVASSIAASLHLETGGTQHFTPATLCQPDGSSQTQTIYILDSSAAAVHSAAPVSDSDDLHDSSQTVGTFIVQDADGNKFEQVTAYDEFGKEIVYFQLAQEQFQDMDDSVEEELAAQETEETQETLVKEAEAPNNPSIGETEAEAAEMGEEQAVSTIPAVPVGQTVEGEEAYSVEPEPDSQEEQEKEAGELMIDLISSVVEGQEQSMQQEQLTT